MVDSICCDDIGGTPGFAATCLGDLNGNGIDDACELAQPEACCLPNGNCVNIPTADCLAQGGTPQGAGSWCSGILVACCVPDGLGGILCIMTDSICCDDIGGTPGFAPTCLGDLNGNGIDDACEQAEPEACCFPDGRCVTLPRPDCLLQGGSPQGPGTFCTGVLIACCLNGGTSCVMVEQICCDDIGGVPGFSPACLGDLNGNGIDDACEELPPPFEPKWSQPPHESGMGFDAASDLWWKNFGPIGSGMSTFGGGARSPGTLWSGHVEAKAKAHQNGWAAHNPADDVRDFKVDDASPSRTWVPNGASVPPGPIVEANWDNDNWVSGGNISWHTAFSGAPSTKGQGKAKAGLDANLNGVVDARARVVNTGIGDSAYGYGKATQNGPLVMIAGDGLSCDATLETTAYVAAPGDPTMTALTAGAAGAIALPVGVAFSVQYIDTAEAAYPLLSPIHPFPGSMAGSELYVNGTQVSYCSVAMTQPDPSGPVELYTEGFLAGVPFRSWTAPGAQGQWYEDEFGQQSYFAAIYQTLVLPEGYHWVEVNVNKVVADDFISDGRPIMALDWFGSYFDQRYLPGEPVDPYHRIDGWFISFHHDVCGTLCPPDYYMGHSPTVLALYFAPVNAITIEPTGIVDCLGHMVFRYKVDLNRCCLLCSQSDPRFGDRPPPGQPEAFYEVAYGHYWLDIQAVVGVTWNPPMCSYEGMIPTEHIPSDLTPDGHFWGWHTSPQWLCPQQGLREACTGRIVDFTPYPPNCWEYGEWVKQPWLCPDRPQPVHMAFDLLAPTCSVMGDTNGDGSLDITDIGCFVDCLIANAAPGCWCRCADMNNDGVANGLDIQLFVNALLGIP